VILSPFGTSVTNWPIVPALDYRWVYSIWWNKNWQEKPKCSEKTCPSATLSTTNPTWPHLGSNLGRRGGKPATNRLSYGTAKWFISYGHEPANHRCSDGRHTLQELTSSKVRGNWIRAIRPTIRSRTFCLLVCCLKTWRLNYYSSFCRSVWVWKLVCGIKGRTKTEGILRTGCWGEYLDRRGMKR
jgi:hypothetical protein